MNEHGHVGSNTEGPENLEPQETAKEEKQENLPNPPFSDDEAPQGVFKQITHWRNRNPRTMSLLMLAIGVPAVISIVLAAPYIFPALALTSAELFGAACVSSTAVVGLAIREGVFRGSVEERQQWPGIIGKAVNWMRENPKYTKAIAIPIVAAAVTAGVLSGGLFIGVGVAAAYIGALGVGMFVASTTALYILPRSNTEHANKAAADAAIKPSIFENVKQFIYEHRLLATVGITLAVGATVLSGGLALGIGMGVAMISASVVCSTTIGGLYAAQVMVKETENKKHAAPEKTQEPIANQQESKKEVKVKTEVEVEVEVEAKAGTTKRRRNSSPAVLGSHTEKVTQNQIQSKVGDVRTP